MAALAHGDAGLALADRGPARLVRVGRCVVDHHVAVVVLPVAHLERRYALRADRTLVDEPVAVVVETVAHLDARRLPRLCDLAHGAVTAAVAHPHARPQAHALAPVVAGRSELREPLVDQLVAVVIEAVAHLVVGRCRDDRREGVGDAVLVVGEEGRRGAARVGDGVELGGVGGHGADSDDVGVDRDAGDCVAQRGRSGDGVALALVDAVGEQHDRVLAARHRAVALHDRLEVVLRGLQRARQRRGPRSAQLTIPARAEAAVVTWQLARVELGLLAVEPRQVLLEGAVEADEQVGATTGCAAGAGVVDAVGLVGPGDVDVGVERGGIAGAVDRLRVAPGRVRGRGVVPRVVVAAADLLALEPLGGLTGATHSLVLVIAGQGEVGVGERSEHVRQRTLRRVQPGVVAVDRVRVAPGVHAEVVRRSVTERRPTQDIAQHRRRAVDHQHEAGTCVGDRPNARGDVGGTCLRHAVHARGHRLPVAGERSEPVVRRSVEVVVPAVAYLTDIGTVDEQLAGAAPRLARADRTHPAERARHVEGRRRVDRGHARQHVDDAAASSAAAVVARAGRLRARALRVALGLRIAAPSA